MAGLSLENAEGSSRDDGLPFEEEALFEWLFEDTDPNEAAGLPEPGPDGLRSGPSGPGSIAEPREGRETAMVERPENQPEEPDIAEGEQGEQEQPGGGQQTPNPSPDGGSTPDPNSTATPSSGPEGESGQ